MLKHKLNSFIKHPGFNIGGDDKPQYTPVQSTQSSSSSPWSGVQPYLSKGYQNLNQWYDQPGPFAYPGATTAGPDPLRQEAQNYDVNYARYGIPSDINKIGSAYDTLLNAPNVNNNPYLAQSVNAAIQPMIDQYNQTVLPGIRSGAVQTGQYGGSRQGIAEGIASGQLTRNIGNTSAGMYSNAYQQGMDSLSKAMLFGPQMIQLGQAPSSVLRGVASENELAQQNQINDAKRLFDYYQNLPYDKLNKYLTPLQGAGFASTSGTSTSNVPSYGGNSTLGTIGGALGLASLGTDLYKNWFA